MGGTGTGSKVGCLPGGSQRLNQEMQGLIFAGLPGETCVSKDSCYCGLTHSHLSFPWFPPTMQRKLISRGPVGRVGHPLSSLAHNSAVCPLVAG